MRPSISLATRIASDPIRMRTRRRERSSAEIHNSIALNMPPTPPSLLPHSLFLFTQGTHKGLFNDTAAIPSWHFVVSVVVVVVFVGMESGDVDILHTR